MNNEKPTDPFDRLVDAVLDCIQRGMLLAAEGRADHAALQAAWESERRRLREDLRLTYDEQRIAGEKCGVSFETWGCKWSGAVADHVVWLQGEVERLKATTKHAEDRAEKYKTDAIKARQESGKAQNEVARLKAQLDAILPELTPEDRAKMASMGPDLVKRLWEEAEQASDRKPEPAVDFGPDDLKEGQSRLSSCKRFGVSRSNHGFDVACQRCCATTFAFHWSGVIHWATRHAATCEKCKEKPPSPEPAVTFPASDCAIHETVTSACGRFFIRKLGDEDYVAKCIECQFLQHRHKFSLAADLCNDHAATCAKCKGGAS